MRFIAIAFLVALSGITYGCEGSPTVPSPGPPPAAFPIGWVDAPTAPVSVNQNAIVSLTMRIAPAVEADYEVVLSNGNVAVKAEIVQIGVLRLDITGINPGTTRVGLEAQAVAALWESGHWLPALAAFEVKVLGT